MTYLADAPQADGSTIRTIAGTIRKSTAGPAPLYGWEVLDNATHTPLSGLRVTSVDAVGISVAWDDPGAGATVGTFVVTPDEHYAQAGLVAGASVTPTGASIWAFYPPTTAGAFGRRLNPTTEAASTVANLWVVGCVRIPPPPPVP